MAAPEEKLPRPEEAAAALAAALGGRQARARGLLASLAVSPPQVLLLEGGTSTERFAMALWWAARLNCKQDGAPCMACASCLQVGARMHRDLFVLDGREGTIKIDAVREVRSVLGEPPRGDGMRVVVFAEAQALGTEAANALLKSLEEPRPGTSFVLLAPQRERLLPTLVSRSWVLTLAWPHADRETTETFRDWEKALVEFLATGRGWMSRTSTRGAVDAPLAQEVVLGCQHALLAVMAERAGGPLSELMAAKLGPFGLAACDELFGQCLEALALQPSPVNPSLVLDRLATRLHLLVRMRRV